MFELLLDLYQQRQISQLKSEVRNEKSDTEFIARREAAKETHELFERLDKLVLVNAAMWSLLTEHTKLTDTDLARRITEMDARDGTRDGRITAQPVKCSCGATVCTKFRRCLFCGKEHPGTGPLHAV